MTTMTATQAQTQGFDIDRDCYPWVAYKGSRFDPYEIHSLVTPRWPDDGDHNKYVHGIACICGEPVTVPVKVRWKNGPRTYWYCAGCAEDALSVEGTEVDMEGENFGSTITRRRWQFHE